MLKAERHKLILAMLERNGFATVEQIAKQLSMSMPTIRRDLSELAEKGMLTRSHGGAMRISDEKITTPIDFRRSINAKEKSLIAKEALRFIHSNSVIFIDASTTAAYIAEYIRDRHDLIVITNSLMSAAYLKDSGIRTYCLGGEVIASSVAVGGTIAVEAASYFNIDIMFFSTYGVNDAGIIVDTSEAETELRRYILKNAALSVFLCDKSKFGRKSVYNFASLSDVDYLITNGDVPENYPSVKKEIIVV